MYVKKVREIHIDSKINCFSFVIEKSDNNHLACTHMCIAV